MSSGVETLPSMKAMSTCAPGASKPTSRKWVISTSAASSSRGSPRFKNASWQPSQELNLCTAMRGLSAMSKPLPVAADELRAVLTVSAVAERALHVALHAEPDVSLRDASRLHVTRDHVHHALGAAQQHTNKKQDKALLIEEIGHTAVVPRPQGLPRVGCEQHLGVGQGAPRRVAFAPDEIAAVFHALHDIEPAVALAAAGDVIDHRHHGRAAEPARHHHHVATLRLLHGPAAAIWSAQTEAIALLDLLHAVRDATDRAYQKNKKTQNNKNGDDGDRDLTGAVQIKHVELPRRVAIGRLQRGIGQPQAQREQARRLLD